MWVPVAVVSCVLAGASSGYAQTLTESPATTRVFPPPHEVKTEAGARHIDVGRAEVTAAVDAFERASPPQSGPANQKRGGGPSTVVKVTTALGIVVGVVTLLLISVR